MAIGQDRPASVDEQGAAAKRVAQRIVPLAAESQVQVSPPAFGARKQAGHATDLLVEVSQRL